ncbi:ATP-binding protein, partial [Streptomyces europaeiscabiei]|nr:ATP-binding protein [Streptomyces europaeiscabiei]
MQWTPALDPKRFHLEKLLAARGVSLDWLNSGDTDPHCPANVARYSIVAASKIIPFHFRDATTDSPEILAWLQELTDQARETQAERGAPVASVNHGRSLLLLGP